MARPGEGGGGVVRKVGGGGGCGGDGTGDGGGAGAGDAASYFDFQNT